MVFESSAHTMLACLLLLLEMVYDKDNLKTLLAFFFWQMLIVYSKFILQKQ